MRGSTKWHFSAVEGVVVVGVFFVVDFVVVDVDVAFAVVVGWVVVVIFVMSHFKCEYLF